MAKSASPGDTAPDPSAGATDAASAVTGDSVASYEHARDELADVVRRLEDGGLSLEESLALWERGEHLARLCQQWLDGARSRIDAVLADEAAKDAARDPERGDAN